MVAPDLQLLACRDQPQLPAQFREHVMARHSAAILVGEWLGDASADSNPLTWLLPNEALAQAPAVISRRPVKPPSMQRLCRVDQPHRPTQFAPHVTALHGSNPLGLVGAPVAGAAVGTRVVGAGMGPSVGPDDGADVGASVGADVGAGVGLGLGKVVG